MKQIMKKSIAMNEGMTGDPKRGQVWSLKVHDREKESPAVLLWKEPEKSGAPFVALPILEESWLACDQDILLSEDEDWLLGLGWCMARRSDHEIEVARDRLRAHLAEVDALTLGLARDFKAGKDCTLPTSHRLVPELVDPRFEARAEYLAFVRDCAKAPLLVVIFTCAKEAFEASMRMLDETEAMALALSTLQQTAVRGSTPKEASVKTDIMEVGPYKIEMELRHDESDWGCSFDDVEGNISEIKLSSPEGNSVPLMKIEKSWEPEDLLPSGKGYLLTLSGSEGEYRISIDFVTGE
jgi:hypothetical protein